MGGLGASSVGFWLDGIQFEVQERVHGDEGAGEFNVVFQVHSHRFADECFEEGVEQHFSVSV